MGWWKADTPAEASSQSAVPPSSPPPASQTPQPNNQSSTSSCPVDPKTREIWLQQAKAQNGDSRTLPPKHPNISSTPATAFTSSPTAQCSSDTISQSPSTTPQPSSRSTERRLSHDRVISSIPRAFPHQPSPAFSPTSTSTSTRPSNSETETGPHPSGNWIYPSEHQFFTAVLRKHNPSTLLSPPSSSSSSTAEAQAETHLASTIPSIIPIHNAVNERAWTLIKKWEEPFYPNKSNPTSTTNPKSKPPLPCTGPRLLSFRGLGSGPPPSPSQSGIPGLLRDYISLLNPTTPLTPKARFNAFLGYQVPFDRHDWTVQRCNGGEVEYVIDFYQGRAPTSHPQQPGGMIGGGKEGHGFGGVNGGLNFYLDVRPKLNSWEGWRTRALGVWRGFWDEGDGRPKAGG